MYLISSVKTIIKRMLTKISAFLNIKFTFFTIQSSYIRRRGIPLDGYS